MVEMFSLKDKVAVITGGNRGLGGAMSLGLAKAGADIVIIQRSKEESEVVQEIKDLGRNCWTFSYDLQDYHGIPKLVEQITETTGKIDILINNAGIQRRSPSEDFSVEDWNDVIDINANAVFFLCQAVGKQMLQQGKGKIVNFASLISFQGGINIPAYAASKGAVMQFTKTLSNEWAKRGINVNGIAPGYMATEMNTALINDDNRNQAILDRIPAGRWGTPEDIVGAAIFLSSEASNYVSGEIITVDGGWMGR